MKTTNRRAKVPLAVVALWAIVLVFGVINTRPADTMRREVVVERRALAGMVTATFDSLAAGLYETATDAKKPRQNKTFVLADWDEERTTGGLHDEDRIRLAEVYGQASSVFEWGLGESTNIAKAMAVPRYAGIDSDAEYVATARTKSPTWFRFYYADIGPTGLWGTPNDRTEPKIIYNYVTSPLVAELKAFDVYYIDGQMRVLCALASFLHAAKYGKPDSSVLIHDYYEEQYSKECTDCHDAWSWEKQFHRLEDVADLVHHNHGEIATFQRKATVTDEELVALFQELKNARLQEQQ